VLQGCAPWEECPIPKLRCLPNFAMGSIAGPFAPDELEKWPQLDRHDPDVQLDEASLALGEMSMP
jgi:hypothetical protein